MKFNKEKIELINNIKNKITNKEKNKSKIYFINLCEVFLYPQNLMISLFTFYLCPRVLTSDTFLKMENKFIFIVLFMFVFIFYFFYLHCLIKEKTSDNLYSSFFTRLYLNKNEYNVLYELCDGLINSELLSKEYINTIFFKSIMKSDLTLS